MLQLSFECLLIASSKRKNIVAGSYNCMGFFLLIANCVYSQSINIYIYIIYSFLKRQKARLTSIGFTYTRERRALFTFREGNSTDMLYSVEDRILKPAVRLYIDIEREKERERWGILNVRACASDTISNNQSLLIDFVDESSYLPFAHTFFQLYFFQGSN